MQLHVPFIAFLIGPRSMKRSMSQTSMCTKCSEYFITGWKMHHHKKICRGIRGSSNLTPLHLDEGQHDKEALSDDDQPEANDLHITPLYQSEAYDLPITEPGILPGAQLSIVRTRSALSTQTKVILKFLATAEKGEGCSREHAQGWLDYHHAEGGPSASFLPKDIRTCWGHVAKV